ncbi:MAG: hypothetical protein IJE62_05980 [Clostridia bacterium]|nr:hypothetical protein [Clostridia bacterium]
MKKIIIAVMIILTLVLSGCIFKKSDDAEYSGDFKNDPMYQKIITIEKCTDPEQLVSILEDIYGEEITYIHLEFDNKTNQFKDPYNEFEFNVFSVYSSRKNKGRVLSDAYAFFKEYHDAPVFIMDQEGTYLVGNYEVETTEEKTYLHKVNSWAASDLFLCLNKYTNKSCQEEYAAMVKTMEYYVDFEKILAQKVDTDDNFVNNTNNN